MTKRVRPDGTLWDVYDGRPAPWDADLSEPWFLRSTILRVIDETMSVRSGDEGEWPDVGWVEACQYIRARFEEDKTGP